MIRYEAIKAFTQMRRDELVITGVGLSHNELFKFGHKDTNLYSIQLSYTVPVALGLALALPSQRIIALEGDGAMLAGLGSLTTVASENPSNLVIIILDNESYDAPSRFPSATARCTDLEAVAQGAGIKNTATATDLNQFTDLLGKALSARELFFLVAKVEKGVTLNPIPKLPFDKTENAVFFRRALIKAGIIDTWREAHKIY